MIWEPFLANRDATTMPKPWVEVPMDDWKHPLEGPAIIRTVSNRVCPDPERLRLFAGRIAASRRPALVFGPEVDRSGGWDGAIALAEKLRAAVYGAPLGDRASFPETIRCSAGRWECR
jgi:benzoylformate decarboxylase